MREEGFAQLYQGLVTWLLQQGLPPASMVYVILGLELVSLLVLLLVTYWVTRFVLFQADGATGMDPPGRGHATSVEGDR